MRIQEIPRTPDETFYFDEDPSYRELVVSGVALGEAPWPNVERYDDRSVIIAVEKQTGEVVTRGVPEHTQHRLYPGERIVDIKTGRGEAYMVESGESGAWEYRIGGEQTDEYVVVPGDELIVKRQFGDYREADKVMTVPAQDFLPGESGVGFRALGIVRPSGALVAWGMGSWHTRRLVDLANANALARDKRDLRRLRKQLLREEHLVGIINCSEQVSAYLGHFLDRFGVDLRPTKDPRER